MIKKLSVVEKEAAPILDSITEADTSSVINLHSKTVPGVSLNLRLDRVNKILSVKINNNSETASFLGNKSLGIQTIRKIITQALLDFDDSLESKLNSAGFTQVK